MAIRRAATVVGFALLGSCVTRQSAAPDAAADADAAAASDDAGPDATCEPALEERGECRRPVEATFCAATWAARPPPMCGLRIYEGPGAGYLLQYVSYVDIPPIGGPSWLCIYDLTSQQLVGVWALDHYLRWCCESSLDMFEGVATNEIANLAYSLATHPACPDAGDQDPAGD
jgi:hypothetical protein